MGNIDLNDLSLRELKKLLKDVTKAIGEFEKRQRRDALTAVDAKAKEMGFNLSDLVGGTTKKAKAAVPPKYRLRLSYLVGDLSCSPQRLS